MTVERETLGGATARRPLLRSMARGFVSRCPACGQGRLFSSWLRPVERCPACDEDYREQRADDLPPYLVIFVVGHVVVAGYLATERLLPTLGAWAQLVLWVPVTLVLCLVLLRPLKGATIGLQWALGMLDRGEDGSSDDRGG